jgi:hypothetical protein
MLTATEVEVHVVNNRDNQKKRRLCFLLELEWAKLMSTRVTLTIYNIIYVIIEHERMSYLIPMCNWPEHVP